MAKASASISKRQQRQEQRFLKKRQQRIKWISIGLVLGIGIFAATSWGVQQYIVREAIGESVPTLGQQHISAGEPHPPYNSDPPTSGSHANAANRGFYESPIPDENLVHNLEHGYVAISYDCDQLADCESVKANLRRILNQYNNRQLIAVPRQNRDAPIALTAWQRIDLLSEYDERRITAFIDAWRGRAPENVP